MSDRRKFKAEADSQPQTAGLTMNDRRESKTEADGQPQTSARKPWHAPSFALSEVEETFAQGNAGTDGATTGADGSLS